MVTNNYKLIVTIVNKGKAVRVLDIAHQAGAIGGTTLDGRGAAVRLFLGISIDPEKEIVLNLIEQDKVQAVLDAITKELDLINPNKGIAFVLSLEQVVGLNTRD